MFRNEAAITLYAKATEPNMYHLHAECAGEDAVEALESGEKVPIPSNICFCRCFCYTRAAFLAENPSVFSRPWDVNDKGQCELATQVLEDLETLTRAPEGMAFVGPKNKVAHAVQECAGTANQVPVASASDLTTCACFKLEDNKVRDKISRMFFADFDKFCAKGFRFAKEWCSGNECIPRLKRTPSEQKQADKMNRAKSRQRNRDTIKVSQKKYYLERIFRALQQTNGHLNECRDIAVCHDTIIPKSVIDTKAFQTIFANVSWGWIVETYGSNIPLDVTKELYDAAFAHSLNNSCTLCGEALTEGNSSLARIENEVKPCCMLCAEMYRRAPTRKEFLKACNNVAVGPLRSKWAIDQDRMPLDASLRERTRRPRAWEKRANRNMELLPANLQQIIDDKSVVELVDPSNVCSCCVYKTTKMSPENKWMPILLSVPHDNNLVIVCAACFALRANLPLHIFVTQATRIAFYQDNGCTASIPMGEALQNACSKLFIAHRAHQPRFTKTKRSHKRKRQDSDAEDEPTTNLVSEETSKRHRGLDADDDDDDDASQSDMFDFC